MDTQHKFYIAISAMGLVIGSWAGIESALTARQTRYSLASLTDKNTGVTASVLAEVHTDFGTLESDINRNLSKLTDSTTTAIGHLTDDKMGVTAMLGKQVQYATDSLTGEIHTAVNDPNTGIIHTLDKRLESIQGQVIPIAALANENINTALNGKTGITSSVNLLSTTYSGLPAWLYATPEAAAVRMEITCRYPPNPTGFAFVPMLTGSSVPDLTILGNQTGTGYGGCMRARINGLLGEGEKAGAAVAKYAEPMAAAITGIATDGHKFTTKATAPCGIWCTVKEILGIGAGIAKATR